MTFISENYLAFVDQDYELLTYYKEKLNIKTRKRKRRTTVRIPPVKSLRGEKWKDIPGYEGSYKVSNLGRIKGLDRIVITKTGFNLPIQGKLIKPHQNNGGYLLVGLYKNGIGTNYLIGRLVLLAWRGTPPVGKECDHIDGNKNNNRLSNLKWITRSENQLKVIKPSKMLSNKRLSATQKQEILRLSHTNLSQKKIAAQVGCARSTVRRITRGQSSAHRA